MRNTWMKRSYQFWGFGIVCLLATPVWAVDHNNLDEGRSLRIEDAYPIAYGELAVEAGAGFQYNRRTGSVLELLMRVFR
jgi:hypothetical protein